MVLYFDTSALVKRYTGEIGSNWVRQLCTPQSRNRIATALISKAEAGAAFASKVRHGVISSSDYQALIEQLNHDFKSEYIQLPIDVKLIDSAVILSELNALRGYDSVQLAAALQLNDYLLGNSLSPLKFISSDTDLLVAAQAEGLATDDPNLHP